MKGPKCKDPQGVNPEGQKRNANEGKSYYSSNGNSPLVRAKAMITIPDAWERLGLAGRPGKTCKSPFRDDKNASFSVFDDGRRWKDFAENTSGDVLDLIVRAKGISLSEASRLLIEWAGEGFIGPASGVPVRLQPIAPKSVGQRQPSIPTLQKPSYEDLRAIQIQRQLPFNAGLEVACNRGLLWTAKVYDQGREWPCWVMADDARRNAQARRLDGKPFGPEGATFKAKTLPGCEKAWPIGAANLGDAANVIMTEGPPDLLAAISLGWYVRDGDIADLGFVCVAGAAGNLAADSMTHFAGKNVRIVYDQDAEGMAAAARWSGQLTAAGASVDGFSLQGLTKPDGSPAKDINDTCHLLSDTGEDEAAFSALFDLLFTFDAAAGKEGVM